MPLSAGRNTAVPAAEIPVRNLRVPPGFRVELWASGMPGIRAMTRTASGKIYAGTRGIGRVYEITDSGRERSSRVLVDRLNQPAGVAYGNGALQPAARAAPQLEVHRLRPGRQALRALRRALQHLRAGRALCADPPLQRGRLQHGSDCARRAQLGGLRLASGDARDVPFVTGFLDTASDSFWGRPVCMLQLPDGSLLLSDEQMGAIYRISYGS